MCPPWTDKACLFAAYRHEGRGTRVGPGLREWLLPGLTGLRETGSDVQTVAPGCWVSPPSSNPSFLSVTPSAPSIAWVRLLVRLGPDAKCIGTQKLSAIYVDFDGRGPLKPERVTEVDAAELLQSARLSVDHAQQALGGAAGGAGRGRRGSRASAGPEMSEFFPPSRDLGLIACQWIISNRMCRDPGGL